MQNPEKAIFRGKILDIIWVSETEHQYFYTFCVFYIIKDTKSTGTKIHYKRHKKYKNADAQFIIKSLQGFQANYYFVVDMVFLCTHTLIHQPTPTNKTTQAKSNLLLLKFWSKIKVLEFIIHKLLYACL